MAECPAQRLAETIGLAPILRAGLGMVEGFLRLMATGDDITGPVNLGNPGEFTIKQLAELVIAETGAKSKLVYRPLPQDDPLQRQPNIALAREKLGWEPKVALKDGLKRTIAYFDDLLRRINDGRRD